MSNKDLIRKHMRVARRGEALSAADKVRMIDMFFDQIAPSRDHIIAAYMPCGGECDALFLVDEACKRGYACALPIILERSRLLEFAPYQANAQMEQGAYGLARPMVDERVCPDIFIVPLLAFDGQGNRLGQGGGYYDVTLAYYRGVSDVCAVGLAYDVQECKDDSFVVEPHDQRLDWILTQTRAMCIS